MVERPRDFETQLLILNLITMDEDKEFTLDNAERFGKYYTEESFWKKLKKFAVKAGNKVVYPALLLYYVLVSRDVPVKDKGLIIGALAAHRPHSRLHPCGRLCRRCRCPRCRT